MLIKMGLKKQVSQYEKGGSCCHETSTNLDPF